MPLPILPLLTPIAISMASIMGFRNSNENTKTSMEIAEKTRASQLQLAELNIQAQKHLEENRQQFQVDLENKRQEFQIRMSNLGFAQQMTIRAYEHEFQLSLRKLDHQHQQSIEEFRAKVNIAINQKNLDFQAWKFEQEVALQKEMALFNRETQFAIAAYQRKTALAAIEAHKIYDNWPLNIMPAQILHSHPGHLRIFISPPELDFDLFSNVSGLANITWSGTPSSQPLPYRAFPRIESFLVTRLRKHLNQYYPRNDTLRPTQLLDGAWNSKRFAGESSIVALAHSLESEPFMVLETKVTLNQYLTLQVAYKPIGQNNYFYDEVIPRFDYGKILHASAKARNKKNHSSDTQKLQITSADWESLHNLLEVAHCIVAAWISDVHHLMYYNAHPLLPQHLPELVKMLPEFMLNDEESILNTLIQEVVKGYQDVFQELEKTEWRYQVPELLLNLAEGVVHFKDKSLLEKLADSSMQSWLQLRGMKFEINHLSNIATKNDIPFLTKLVEFYKSTDETELSAKITDLIQSVQTKFEPIQQFVY
ncbi:hypothetical protein QUF75_13220 [Desulfococcaceae bacterium HSG7]|nr:hypothetical protein [Desulfococcaceae bacterium HSG7]